MRSTFHGSSSYLLATTMLTPIGRLPSTPMMEGTQRALKQHAANLRTTGPVRWEWFERWRAMQIALMPPRHNLFPLFRQFGTGPLVPTMVVDRR